VARRLHLVYALKTESYDWAQQFYPIRRLLAEAEVRGMDMQLELAHDALSERALWPQLPGDTIMLVRGSAPQSLRQTMEMAGFLVVNSSTAWQLARDKLASYRFLAERGDAFPAVRWPASIGTADTADTLSPEQITLEHLLRFLPLIAKPRDGLMGRDVFLLETAAALHNFWERADRERFLLQDYVPTSRGRDLRMFFAGTAGTTALGTVLASFERQSDALVSNVAANGQARPINLDTFPGGKAAFERLQRQTLEIARASGLHYGTVDYLFGPDESFPICELNGSPGFEAAEEALKINIAGAILDSLQSL